MTTPPLEAGTLIADRYRLEREIGRGGMGTVWRAQHLALQGPVAIKLINTDLLSSDEAKARFLREARAAAALRSTHVVQILDHGLHEEQPYIVMELLQGESLADRLLRSGGLSHSATVALLEPVCRALSLAHERQIIHRDLKPDNIFIAAEGDQEVVKVLDFGIAKDNSTELQTSLQTQEGAILGTPYYLSPEQAQGSRDVDHRADLWSLGVIVCECLTGQRPFESKHMGDLIVRICSRPLPVPSALGEVPPGFDAWFATALARDPNDRYQSSASLLNALRELDPAGQPLPASASDAPLGAESQTLSSEAKTLSEAPTQAASLAAEADTGQEPSESPRTRLARLLSAAALLVTLSGLWLWSSAGDSGVEDSAPALAASAEFAASEPDRLDAPTAALEEAAAPAPEPEPSPAALSAEEPRGAPSQKPRVPPRRESGTRRKAVRQPPAPPPPKPAAPSPSSPNAAPKPTGDRTAAQPAAGGTAPQPPADDRRIDFGF